LDDADRRTRAGAPVAARAFCVGPYNQMKGLAGRDSRTNVGLIFFRGVNYLTLLDRFLNHHGSVGGWAVHLGNAGDIVKSVVVRQSPTADSESLES
jgi:hypothetical protein